MTPLYVKFDIQYDPVTKTVELKLQEELRPPVRGGNWNSATDVAVKEIRKWPWDSENRFYKKIRNLMRKMMKEYIHDMDINESIHRNCADMAREEYLKSSLIRLKRK